MYYELNIKETKVILVWIILFLIVIIPLHFMIQAGLSVATKTGCRRDWAADFELDSTYKALIRDCYI